MKPVALTIGIPTRNRAGLLRETVTRCLNQTVAEIDVVVSDNASTDATPQVLADLAAPRLHVLRQDTNIGMVPNWNACLARARGEWFLLCSDDDLLEPDFAERYLAAAAACPEADLVVGPVRSLDHASGTTMPEPAVPPDGLPALLTAWLRGNVSILLCGTMFRTAVLQERGGFDVSFPYAADTATWLPLLLTRPHALERHPHATYVFHHGGMTFQLGLATLLADEVRLYQLLWQQVQTSPLLSSTERNTVLGLADQRQSMRAAIMLLDYAKAGASKLELIRCLFAYWRLMMAYPRPLQLAGAIFTPQFLMPLATRLYRRLSSQS